jgi:transcriptional regulator with XRE-family HTH domain
LRLAFGKYVKLGQSEKRSHGRNIVITAAQCRSARTLLSWSVSKLASAASVSDSAIDDFEMERRLPPPVALEAIQRAFEDVGVIFLPGDDVRLRAAA